METTTSSSHAYRIDPLLGAENYAVWKIKMTDILTDQGYMDIVDGSEPLPTVEAQIKLWKKKDRAALSMIRLRIADKMLIYVASSTTITRGLGYNQTDVGTSGGSQHCTGTKEIIPGSVQG